MQHRLIVPVDVQAHGVMESRAMMVAHAHRGKDGIEEEPDPPDIAAARQLGVGAHQQSEGFAMAELVIAPFLEPFEDRVETLVGMRLKVTVDRDIARIADLLAEIGGVVDEFRPEIGVFLRLGQETQVDPDPGFAQRVVDEAGMARLVPLM